MITADIMTHDVVLLEAESLVDEAVHLMLTHKVSGLPVLGRQGNLAGMITIGDLLRRTEIDTEPYPRGTQPFFQLGRQVDIFIQAHGGRVSDIMTTNVATAVESTPLRDVVTLMQTRHVGRLPVMRDRMIVGIVARIDIVRALGGTLDAQTAVPRPGPHDLAIRQQLQAKLSHAGNAPSGLTFKVTDARVQLYAPACEEQQREWVQALAENVPDVVSVEAHFNGADTTRSPTQADTGSSETTHPRT